MTLFEENAEMPSGVNYEIKTEPDNFSGRETVEKSQDSVKELQGTLQRSMRAFYSYHLKYYVVNSYLYVLYLV